ncbi:DEAD/DEAH box helicase [Mesobaculum littorinae]|uniref:DEAD/DEAH box helicase n=1 Tax=Mesobaculum littorinae TaxID=2486419 RepID=A0A438AIX9_9RHOB|nr:DEAD/DEAH box helicase [Mesobaculum littorinae]RVV98713.1 DEAD/DEAH box helicase [Mesobaculum littorinae]
MDFDMLGLQPALTTALARQGITDPSPIQTKAIPHAMQGRDVMGLAQTGSGKTLAFGLPILEALLAEPEKAAPKTVRGLVLAPTRELARQITESLGALAEGTGLRIGLVVGGVSPRGQAQRLARGTDILVATPGRLIDHLDNKAVRLDATRFLVLDEADQMLDLGFIHALRRIAPLLPKDRQTMLFSATMPKQMEELSRAYLTSPVRVEVAPPGQVADRIEQEVHFVEKSDKPKLLAKLLDTHRDELALVFSRTKHGAERLMKGLVAQGFAAASIHGNKSQGQRDRALNGFRSGEIRVLVATDVAARGIDIPEIRHVYNFDLPNVAETYVHRIGRTARAGASGRAVAFCDAEEMGDLRAIEKQVKMELDVAGGTPWPDTGRSSGGGRGKPSGKSGGRGNRGGGNGGGRPARGAKPASDAPAKRRPRRRKPAARSAG